VEERDFAGGQMDWVTGWHWKGMVPILIVFGPTFPLATGRSMDSTHYCAHREHGFERLLSDEELGENVQEKINDE
jgi:hypothetical protein